MGSGCQRVRCLPYADMDVIAGEWADGRTGVVRGTRLEKNEFGCLVHTAEGLKTGLPAGAPPNYFSLLEQVIPFFQTGQAPIALAETFEITAFLEAANTGREQGGAVVDLAAL